MPERAATTSRTSLPNAAQGRRGTGTPGELRGSGRTRRGREARERLLAAARMIFERDGFLHARIADICSEAGLSQPSFYTYFHSKEEILDELIAGIDLDLLSMPPSAERESPQERIRSANRHYLAYFRDNSGILRVIDQLATFDGDARAHRAERQKRFAAAIARRIQQLQEAGEADPRVDPAFAAKALGGMVTAMAGFLFVDRGHGGRQLSAKQFDDAVDQLTLLWLNAIGMDSGGESP